MTFAYDYECLLARLADAEDAATALLRDHCERLPNWVAHRVATVRHECEGAREALAMETLTTETTKETNS